MIRFSEVMLADHSRKHRPPLIQGLSFDFPTNSRFGLLASSAETRRSLVALLSGVEKASAGQIFRYAHASYPVGYLAGFNAKISVRANLTFIATLYGVDATSLIRFMSDLLGGHAELDVELGDLPHSLRTLLGFGVTYALPFDVYVANGATMPGEPEHRTLLAPWVEKRLKESGLILVTGSPVAVRDICDVVGVWHEGQIQIFSEVKEAIAIYSARRQDHGREAGAS